MLTLNCKGRLLTSDTAMVMGIINATPDSFYGGSRHTDTDAILARAEKMLGEGADIIDIGGQSTRPGSVTVDADEELKRVMGGIEALQKHFPAAFISIDTFYSRVAREAVAAGACIVNDISAGSIDNDLIATVASLQVPYVLMHMKGKPGTMHTDPQYDNVTKEVLDFFIHEIIRIRHAGIKDIIVDPGFGFGKTIQHNFELLRNFSVFKILDSPLLAGISRKSTIYKTLHITPEEALNGTTVLNTVALVNGASILRVHDVKEAREAVRLVRELGIGS